MNAEQTDFNQADQQRLLLKRLLKGATTLAQAVAAAYGPHSRQVVIGTSDSQPFATRSGLAIAETIKLKDTVENAAAALIIQAARKTQEKTGGGASTTIILAEAILRESIKDILGGTDPLYVQRGLLGAAKVMSGALSRLSKPCMDELTIARVATLAARGDPVLGQMIAHAFAAAGHDTVVLKEGATHGDELKIIQGLQFESSCIDGYFTGGATRIKLERPYIAIVDTFISDHASLTSLLKAVAQFSRPLLMIVTDVDTASLKALMMLLANNRRSVPKLVVVKPLAMGEHKHHWLEGLAVMIGGNVIAGNTGSPIERAGLNQLGTARSVLVTRSHTTLIGGGGSKRVIGAKIGILRREIEKAASQHEKDGLRQNLTALSTGIAVISLGGTTDLEIKDRKALAERALASASAAFDEGILPGGGVGLLLARNAISDLQDHAPDQAAGIQVILNAVEEPLRRIVENGGGTPEVVVNRITRNNDRHCGYNAATAQFGDVVEMGIVDPTQTIRCALENAAMAAGQLIVDPVISKNHPQEMELF
jgi:chaperonin GroEL